MEDQHIPGKNYTVGALLLHAIVLGYFAATSYFDSLTPAGFPMGGMARLAAVFFGVLCAISVWLTGQHYEETVSKKSLQAWAAFNIAPTLYFLPIMLASYITHPYESFLANLLPVLLFLIPPVLVVVFASREWT